MILSEYIQKLEKIKSEHGDLPVRNCRFFTDLYSENYPYDIIYSYDHDAIEPYVADVNGENSEKCVVVDDINIDE